VACQVRHSSFQTLNISSFAVHYATAVVIDIAGATEIPHRQTASRHILVRPLSHHSTWLVAGIVIIDIRYAAVARQMQAVITPYAIDAPINSLQGRILRLTQPLLNISLLIALKATSRRFSCRYCHVGHRCHATPPLILLPYATHTARHCRYASAPPLHKHTHITLPRFRRQADIHYATGYTELRHTYAVHVAAPIAARLRPPEYCHTQQTVTYAVVVRSYVTLRHAYCHRI